DRTGIAGRSTRDTNGLEAASHGSIDHHRLGASETRQVLAQRGAIHAIRLEGAGGPVRNPRLRAAVPPDICPDTDKRARGRSHEPEYQIEARRFVMPAPQD